MQFALGKVGSNRQVEITNAVLPWTLSSNMSYSSEELLRIVALWIP